MSLFFGSIKWVSNWVVVVVWAVWLATIKHAEVKVNVIRENEPIKRDSKGIELKGGNFLCFGVSFLA